MKQTFNPTEVKLAFPVSPAIAEKQAEVRRLRTLCADAEEEGMTNRVRGEILAELAKNLAASECSARAAIGWEVGEKYVQAMRKLIRANGQAVEDGNEFMSEDEREHAYFQSSDTDAILELWEDATYRNADAALLTKYEKAISAYVRDVTPRCDRSSDGDYEPVLCYGDVIQAARDANAAQEVAT